MKPVYAVGDFVLFRPMYRNAWAAGAIERIGRMYATIGGEKARNINIAGKIAMPPEKATRLAGLMNAADTSHRRRVEHSERERDKQHRGLIAHYCEGKGE